MATRRRRRSQLVLAWRSERCDVQGMDDLGYLHDFAFEYYYMVYLASRLPYVAEHVDS